MAIELTLYEGLAGDRNERGTEGASLVAAELQGLLGLEAQSVGQRRSPVQGDWSDQLEAARPDLSELASRLDEVFSRKNVSVTAFNRCAAAIATLPVVAKHHPDALILWFDGHADINVPENTTTGYLGGIAFSASLGLWDSGFGSGVTSANAVLVGARDIDDAEAELIANGAVQAVAVNDFTDLATIAAGRSIYVHIDCDVLEPGQVPTEYSVEGGFSLADLRAIAEILSRSQIVGLEIGEFESRWVETGEPGNAGALVEALAPLLSAAGSS